MSSEVLSQAGKIYFSWTNGANDYLIVVDRLPMHIQQNQRLVRLTVNKLG